MNAMTRVEEHEILTARIRALQAIYAEAHEALRQWGLWSMDRRGIYPVLAPSPMWDQFRRDGTEGYAAEIVKGGTVKAETAGKAEGPERQDYDEKLAVALDERMHGYGGLAEYVRLAIKTAYATRELPEYQFPHFSNCSTWDQFCERLEAALVFVGRFV